ncbi:9734_t:CDS:2, partial [Racocetra persica]
KFPVWSKKLDVHNQERDMKHGYAYGFRLARRVPVSYHLMRNNPASAVIRPQSKLGFFMHVDLLLLALFALSFVVVAKDH